MKYFYLATILFFLTVQLKAQAPNALNYQGVARNSSGTVLTNQNISLRFTIHQGSAGGTIVYQETKATTTNQLGLFTAAIGSGVVVSGTFATIAWGTNIEFLQVEMDPNGGNSYLDMGTNQFLSVPYALNSGGIPAGTNAETLYYNGATLTVTGTLTNDGSGDIGIVQTAASSGTPTALTVKGGASTGLAASTEANDVYFNLNRTVTFATGALATQRAVYIAAPTYAFSGASTITNAATVDISGPPVAGTNATITNPVALAVETGNTGLGTVAPATNARLAISNGHIEIQQSSATAVAIISGGGLGNPAKSPSVSSANCTDVSGTITCVAAAPSANTGPGVQVTFTKPYTTAPLVYLQLANNPGTTSTDVSVSHVYVTSTKTGFTIGWGVSPTAATTYVFNYFVIEPQ